MWHEKRHPGIGGFLAITIESQGITLWTVKKPFYLLGVFCALVVVGISASSYLRSRSQMGQEAAVYAFDGRRYVIDSALPELPFMDVRPFNDITGAMAVIGDLQIVGSLRSIPIPGILLADTGSGIIPLIAIEMDRTFVKAYEPRVGLVIYRRRALETEYLGFAGTLDVVLP